MKLETYNEEVSSQKKKVFEGQPNIKLIHPCKVGNGIVNFSLFLRDELIKKFEQSNASTCFFVPASGSGSRMFESLYEFLAKPDNQTSGSFERFLNHVEEFAFYQKVPFRFRESNLFEENNLEQFIRFLLDEGGLGLAQLPKGLIPFHRNGPFVLNAFQEQVLQASKLRQRNLEIHFTVNPKFEENIRESIRSIEDLTASEFNVSFSIQEPTTDAIAFRDDQTPVLLPDGNFLTRPAGHGALLENLNRIESDLIFIKNIDNIQNFNKSSESSNALRYLGGIALWFKEECSRIVKKPSLDRVKELNRQFQFISEKEIEKLKTEDIPNLFDRPLRVCGMVRNEGQPGGGPFWVEDNGAISKQIVEKAQISKSPDQYKIMVQSTHFNPVMIAAITRDEHGRKYDLKQFSDPEKFFIVDKKYKGKNIHFRELPGLWNGSMAFWNTIFVELPSETFSPVKSVLDLLEKAHQEH